MAQQQLSEERFREICNIVLRHIAKAGYRREKKPDAYLFEMAAYVIRKTEGFESADVLAFLNHLCKDTSLPSNDEKFVRLGNTLAKEMIKRRLRSDQYLLQPISASRKLQSFAIEIGIDAKELSQVTLKLIIEMAHEAYGPREE